MKTKSIKQFLLLAILLFSSGVSISQTERERDFLFFTTTEIQNVKHLVAIEDPAIVPFIERLKIISKSLMKKGPWSVTFTPSPAASGNPHDYFSEGSYWWPDPSDPKKPYIRKDGERNPDRFDKHRRDLELMSQSVLALSISSYLLDSPKFADRAIEFMKVWFINQSTRMNPHMQYAQAIRNRSDGRGVGIIDSRSFVYVLEGINFLKASNNWNDTIDRQIKSWFKEYLDWLTQSKNGLDEKKGGNNHSTWWSVQVGAIADFLNETEILSTTFDYVKNVLIEKQIEADGTQPKEEARTNSLGYSFFNLDAYSMILRLAKMNGINLWNYQNKKGGSVIQSVEYILPYLKDPGSWEKQQISPLEISGRRFLALAGLDLDKTEYINIYKLLMDKSNSGKEETEVFIILLNMSLIASASN